MIAKLRYVFRVISQLPCLSFSRLLTVIKVISNNEFESETVEIWDIRRGWIGKWGLEDAEGGITGA
jgi:hypothetical protein